MQDQRWGSQHLYCRVAGSSDTAARCAFVAFWLMGTVTFALKTLFPLGTVLRISHTSGRIWTTPHGPRMTSRPSEEGASWSTAGTRLEPASSRPFVQSRSLTHWSLPCIGCPCNLSHIEAGYVARSGNATVGPGHGSTWGGMKPGAPSSAKLPRKPSSADSHADFCTRILGIHSEADSPRANQQPQIFLWRALTAALAVKRDAAPPAQRVGVDLPSLSASMLQRADQNNAKNT